MTTATEGAGNIVLGTALSGSQEMPAAYDGFEIDYAVIDGAEWEEGRGTYHHSLKMISRELVFASSHPSGGWISLSGNAVVFSTISSATMEGLMVGADELVPPTSFPAAGTVTITDIPTTYRQLLLVIRNASCASSSRRIVLRVSTDNGASFESSDYLANAHNAAGTHFQLSGTISAPPVLQGASGAEDRFVLLTGCHGGAYPMAVTIGSQSDVANGFYSCTGVWTGSQDPVNALAMIWAPTANNFDGGTYALYGIR